MVVAAFPVAKLGAIFLKQISKPLANAVKTRAKSSPFFRNYICMPPAQFYHWAEVRIKMWSMNLGKPVNIPKLNETMAIDLGAELVGEGLIFVIAAGVLVLEYVRSSRKEAAKEEERKQEMIQIQDDLKELYFTNARLQTQVKELVRILHINIPHASFNPQDANLDSIPAHHREDHPPEEESGLMHGLKELIWDAIELILPEVDDSKSTTTNSSTAGSVDTSTPTPTPTQKDATQSTTNDSTKTPSDNKPGDKTSSPPSPSTTATDERKR